MSDDIRGQIILRLQELANKPRRSRTQQELQEARELLEVLKTKQEIYNFPKRCFFDSVKQNFDLAKLNEDIEDFANPKRSYLKELRQDVEIKELKHRLRALDGPAKPLPWRGIFYAAVAIIVVLFFAALSNAPPGVQQHFMNAISLPVGLVFIGWLIFANRKRR